MTVVVTLLTLVVVLCSILIVGLLRSHAEILRRLHSLEADGAAPRPSVDVRAREDLPAPPTGAAQPTIADLAGIGLDDDAVALAVVGVTHHTLLAVLSSGCATCGAFWSAFGASDLGLPDGLRPVIVTQGGAHERVATLRTIAPSGVPLVMSDDAWRHYEVPGSPYFVLVDGEQGRIVGSGTGVSWEQVRRMLTEAMSERPSRPLAGIDVDHVDVDREARIDRELAEAGIRPGDPSLYHPVPPT